MEQVQEQTKHSILQAIGQQTKQTTTKTTTTAKASKEEEEERDQIVKISQNIVDYYSNSQWAYEVWSPNWNMHFGIYNGNTGLFDREAQLLEHNRIIMERLMLNPDIEQLVGDMGCGLGSVARYVAKKNPKTKVLAATIVATDVKLGNDLALKEGIADRVLLVQSDYRHLPIKDCCLDGVYALESLCYDLGTDKKASLQEMFRVLKPGKRFSVGDGCLKCDPSELYFPTKYVYDVWKDGWAVPELANIEEFKRTAIEVGFEDVEVIDVSFRALPSLIHCVAIFPMLIKKRMMRTDLPKRKKAHWKAALASIFLWGLDWSSFGYFHITGRKPAR